MTVSRQFPKIWVWKYLLSGFSECKFRLSFANQQTVDIFLLTLKVIKEKYYQQWN